MEHGRRLDGQLPDLNLGTLPFAKVARLTNTQVNSTLFRGTFTKPRLTEIIALCRHNLTLDARWRVRLYVQIRMRRRRRRANR